MSKFIARTRLRGTVDYYKAIWRKETTGWSIQFIQGPDKGVTRYKIEKVAIAADDLWRVRDAENR